MRAEGERKSKFEIVVFFVRADPEPIIGAVALPGEGAVAATDLGRVNATLSLEAERGMARVRLKKSEVFVGQFLHVPGKLLVALPERRQRV